MSIPEINIEDISAKKYRFVAVNEQNLNEYKEFTDLLEANKWKLQREKEGKNMDIITMSEWLFIQSNKTKKK